MYLRLVSDPKVPDSEQDEAADAEAARTAGARALLKRREFLTAIFLNFAYLWMIGAAFDTLVPLFGDDGLGMSNRGIGVIFAISLVGELAVLYPAGSLMD